MRKHNRLTFLLIFVLFLGVGCSSVRQANVHTELSAPIDTTKELSLPGYAAPKLKVTDLKNTAWDSSSLNNKPTLINFWASWCGYCEEEMPELEKLYQQYQGKINFLAVDLTVSDKEEDVKHFVKAHHLSLPIYLDNDGSTMKTYQVVSIPSTFIVDRKGMIVQKIVGPIGMNGGVSVSAVKKWFDELIASLK